MNHAQFRFYGELNDFLPHERRQVAFAHPFDGSPSVKNQIEALGVPHPEVALILANGEAVPFSYQLQTGDRISVYPRFTTLDVVPAAQIHPEPLPEPRFVVDIHLGRLAGYLRILGFDTLYRNDYEDEEIARIAGAEARIVLTRDRGLLKRKGVVYGYCPRESDPRRQVVEVLRHFALFASLAPFRRCIGCNGPLQAVEKRAVEERLPSPIREIYHEFSVCGECDQVYWKGPHFQEMQEFVAQVLEQERGSGVRGRGSG
jgi:uncharacterized protein